MVIPLHCPYMSETKNKNYIYQRQKVSESDPLTFYYEDNTLGANIF